MRAVLITLTYPPEPASQLHALLNDLKFSYNVDSCIITSVPSYPIGKVYQGYKNSFSVETISDLKVYRGPIFPSQSKNIFHRGLFYLSNLFSTVAILFYRRKFKDEIFIIYQPPVTSFLAFFFFNLFFKRKFIFWINDMWPETLINFGIKNKFILFIIESVYKYIYFKASKIVVLSPGFKNILLKKGVDEEKIEIIYNWNSSNEVAFNKTNLSDELKMIYAGNLGKFQNLETAIYAIDKLRLEGFKISFEIYGTGTEIDYLSKILISQNLSSFVKLKGRIDYSEVSKKLHDADFLFAQLMPSDLFSKTIPHKIYEYMSVSKPIIGAFIGDAADEISLSNSGLVCEPGSVDSIYDAIKKMISFSSEERRIMGENGRNFVTKNRSLSNASRSFYYIIKEIDNNE